MITRLKTSLIAKLGPIFLRHLDGVVVPALGLSTALRADGWNRPIGLVHNPLAIMMPPPSKLQNMSGVRIVSVGRLVPQKRFDVLIRAVAEFATYTDVRLKIFGTGPLLTSLRELSSSLNVGDRVEFMGFSKEPDEIYRSADIFVLASDFEGFGLVLIEALAYGLPIVATDAPYGPREILGGGTFGDLVECGDSHALCEAMINVRPGSDRASVLRRIGPGRAYEFRPSVVIQSLLEYLETIS